MLQSYLGAECFQRSLASYIKRYACSNAKTEDLWAALKEGYGELVNKLMDSWTKQMGCPVVSVKVNDQKLEFEQEKFGSQMRESFDGTSEDSNNDDDDVDIVEATTKKELSIWTKVVGSISKGRIYGLGSLASTVCVETTPSTPHACNSTTRELARCGKKDTGRGSTKDAKGNTRHEEANNMEQLLASYGMPIPSPPSLPLDTSVGSSTLLNKDQ